LQVWRQSLGVGAFLKTNEHEVLALPASDADLVKGRENVGDAIRCNEGCHRHHATPPRVGALEHDQLAPTWLNPINPLAW
jgi:hypothetical protein